MVPRNAAHGHTPDKHRNPAHDDRTHQFTTAQALGNLLSLQHEERGKQHLLWLRPWWNVPGAGPVTMASLETPALAEDSALKERTWRGNWEMIPRELEFMAPGSFGLPDL